MHCWLSETAFFQVLIMARGRPSSAAYDDDDYDDGYDEEYYEEEEEEEQNWEAEHSDYRYDKSSSSAEKHELTVDHGVSGVASPSDHAVLPLRKDGEAARDIADVSTHASGPAGRGGGESEEKKWSCGTCTFDNVARFLACDVCGAPRPDGGSVVGTHATRGETPDHLAPPVATSHTPANSQRQPEAATAVPVSSFRKAPGSSTTPQVAKRVTLGSCSSSETSSKANAVAASRVTGSETAHQGGRTVTPPAKGGMDANRRATVATADLSTGMGGLQVGGRPVKGKGAGGEAVSGRRAEKDGGKDGDGERGSVVGRESAGGGESALRLDKEEEERRKAAAATEREERRRAALKEYQGEEWVKEMGKREGGEGEKPTLHLIVVRRMSMGTCAEVC